MKSQSVGQDRAKNAQARSAIEAYPLRYSEWAERRMRFLQPVDSRNDFSYTLLGKIR